MKNLINKTYIEGLVYEHNLELKVTGQNSKNPGTEFIAGDVKIATDNDCLNVVPVHFTYVTATTSKGKANSAFNVLKGIIDGTYKSVMKNGKDNATKIKIDSAIGLNEFYSDRTGTQELVSAKRNEGGFITVIDILTSDENKRNTFECDMVITGFIRHEADAEKGTAEYGVVKGAIFDFRKSLLPVEFIVTTNLAIDYFESKEPNNKNPFFTKVWGNQISTTVVKTITEENAFGEAKVREITNTRKSWVITGALPENYVWDDEGTLTVKEFAEMIATRETYLATLKQRQDEYKASKNNAISATPAGGFNF